MKLVLQKLLITLQLLLQLLISRSNESGGEYSNQECDGFMVLMAGKLPWKEKENLSDSFLRLSDRIRILSHQMTTMNTTLTVYASDKIDINNSFKYPNVIIETFDSEDLLISYGFKDLLPIMNQWHVKSYTRTSDILRILLAHKYKKTYIDTDIHILENDRHLFFKPFIGAAMWSDVKCAIELSNSAFCLPKNVLEDMITFIRNRIQYGNSKYFYTELGHVRKGNSQFSYIELIHNIRNHAGFSHIDVNPNPKPPLETQDYLNNYYLRLRDLASFADGQLITTYDLCLHDFSI
eukprot:gene7696-15751_t